VRKRTFFVDSEKSLRYKKVYLCIECINIPLGRTVGVKSTLDVTTKPGIGALAPPLAKPETAGLKSRSVLRVRAVVLGASGYVGRELLTLLARHPGARVVRMISSTSGGKKPFPIEQVHPALRGRFGIPCLPLDLEGLAGSSLLEAVGAPEADVAFLATPHETSRDVVPTLLDAGLRVIDLSGAFRLKDSAAYPRWYGFEHGAAEALAEAVYGLPELHASAIANARLLSNPGCYATSVILALSPLLRCGWVDRSAGIISDSKSGASGAGRTPSGKLHFPEVNENCRAYGLFTHRHIPEMLQALEIREKDFIFTPHLLPITRGILSTVYVRLNVRRALGEVVSLFKQLYAPSPLVRVYEGGALPEIQAVANTQYADLGFALDEETRRLVVVSALDNLGKGAAGQAVQNMNLMFGLPQELGLV
jgi:N-acetyl-gamma-glutamyl-phosphate reductase